jgi:hypothetical protein
VQAYRNILVTMFVLDARIHEIKEEYIEWGCHYDVNKLGKS